MTTTYTKRDIRAADMLALILVGLGIVFAVLAVLALVESSGGDLTKSGKVIQRGGSSVGLWLGAVVFGALGTALNLKVRQLVRNKGRESVDYDGVPD